LLRPSDFNPGNPNVVYRTAELQALDEMVYYLDGIWALDAESPAAAELAVSEGLNSIPIPQGLKLKSAEISNGGEGTVYDNRKGVWLDPNNNCW